MSLNNQKNYKQNSHNFKSAYSKKQRLQISFNTDSRWTKQAFKDECDINNIMGRYIASGEIPALNQTAPQYLDTTGLEFQQAMEFVAGAQSMFEELPSSIRNRFQNDPASFLDFCSMEKNRPELAAMGLLRDEVALALMGVATPTLQPHQEAVSPSPTQPSPLP